MSVFKISNNIFSEKFLEHKLTPNELYVYIYLCSVHSHTNSMLGEVVKVKQATIARKCQIKTTETVSRIINSLVKKGLIESVIKTVKANRHRGTNSYILKKPSNMDGFFYIDRAVFGELSARQMRVYLFISKALDHKRNDSWNSYNDIAKAVNISRQEAIKMVDELYALNFITKSLRKAKHNRRLFVDNHYRVVPKAIGCIKTALKGLFIAVFNRITPQINRVIILLILFSACLYSNFLHTIKLKMPYS